jgi:peptidoglycan/xylan/chitin deacetylase (PgdA/CDA1 family)
MGSPVRQAVRRSVAYLFAARREPEPRLRILTYHRVNGTHPKDRLSVSPDAFSQQMEELRASGRPLLAVDSALPALRGEVPLPDGAVAVTFDDGFRDNFTVALPILDRFKIPAAFLIATAHIGSSTTLERYRHCCDDDRTLAWDHVREILARGHSVGGHSRTHRELPTLDPPDLQDEVEGCRRDIQAQTGLEPDLFAYPRGRENALVRQAVATAGFGAACSVYPGSNGTGIDLFALRRTEISGADEIGDFRAKLGGAFDGWHRLVQRVESWGRP